MEFKPYRKASRTEKTIAIITVGAMVAGTIIGALGEGWNWAETSLPVLFIMPALLGFVVWWFTDDEEVERAYMRKVLIPSAFYVFFLFVFLTQLPTNRGLFDLNEVKPVTMMIVFLIVPQPWIEFFRILYADFISSAEDYARYQAKKKPNNIKGDQA